jgi:hypothetical protein
MSDQNAISLREHFDIEHQALRRELDARFDSVHEAINGVRGQMFAQNAHTRDQLVDVSAAMRDLAVAVHRLELSDANEHGQLDQADKHREITNHHFTRSSAIAGAVFGVVALVKSFVG